MKHLATIIIAIVALLASSCSDNNPSSVIEKALTALSDNDYMGVASLMCDINGDPLSSEQQQLFAAKLKLKAFDNLQSFRIVEENYADDGNTILVKYRFASNGKTCEEKIKILKCPDGKWRIYAPDMMDAPGSEE